MWFKASAPGSLMVLGEYAVLHNKHAVVCAVDKRMTVKLTPRDDDQVFIKSALGLYQSSLAKLRMTSPFQFILTTLQQFKKKFPSGFSLEITSEFSDKIGFASSAAVTVATLSVLNAWLKLSFSPLKMAKEARLIVRKVQGTGSGADVAACVFGGMILYRVKPFSIKKLPYQYPISVVYSGSKTPTVEAIAYVDKLFSKNKNLFKCLLTGIDQCAKQGATAIRKKDWKNLGKIMNIQQGLMDALGVNTDKLQEIVYTLRSSETIYGAKISGSGLGDCVIGLGELPPDFTLDKSQQIKVNITNRGVICEKG